MHLPDTTLADARTAERFRRYLANEARLDSLRGLAAGLKAIGLVFRTGLDDLKAEVGGDPCPILRRSLRLLDHAYADLRKAQAAVQNDADAEAVRPRVEARFAGHAWPESLPTLSFLGASAVADCPAE